MKPTKTLPPDYQTVYALDLVKNVRVALFLNLAVLITFFIFGGVFSRISAQIRPEMAVGGEQSFLADVNILSLVIAFIVMVLLHEGIHGFFFWVFTKERPNFGFKLLYAFAAAPEWYIPRNQFIWVGSSPLVLISIAGVALMPLFPISWISGLVFLLTFNAAGSMGDVYTIIKALTYPKDILINDQGESFTIYGLGENPHEFPPPG
jgi:hypothetical protein